MRGGDRDGVRIGIAALAAVGAAAVVVLAVMSSRSQAPGAPSADEPSLLRPVATYSIVARDPATGEMGVAVQSHWFSVGSVVPWAQAGVGVVATQSLVDPAYGPKGLELMRKGVPAPKALE